MGKKRIGTILALCGILIISIKILGNNNSTNYAEEKKNAGSTNERIILDTSQTMEEATDVSEGVHDTDETEMDDEIGTTTFSKPVAKSYEQITDDEKELLQSNNGMSKEERLGIELDENEYTEDMTLEEKLALAEDKRKNELGLRIYLSCFEGFTEDTNVLKQLEEYIYEEATKQAYSDILTLYFIEGTMRQSYTQKYALAKCDVLDTYYSLTLEIQTGTLTIEPYELVVLRQNSFGEADAIHLADDTYEDIDAISSEYMDFTNTVKRYYDMSSSNMITSYEITNVEVFERFIGKEYGFYEHYAYMDSFFYDHGLSEHRFYTMPLGKCDYENYTLYRVKFVSLTDKSSFIKWISVCSDDEQNILIFPEDISVLQSHSMMEDSQR